MVTAVLFSTAPGFMTKGNIADWSSVVDKEHILRLERR